MKLLHRLGRALGELTHPDRRERTTARRALGDAAARRTGVGECLTPEDRCGMLARLIKGLPEGRRQVVLQEAARSRSQLMQDLFVVSELGDRRDRGFFVEFGATDGVALSNSWLLEKRLGWRGILAEPARCWHEALRRNRTCVVETECVWSRTGEWLDFTEVASPEYSTLSEFAAADAHAQIRTDCHRYQVATVSLLDLMLRHAAPSDPDFLSIDTEGSELEILRDFAFDRYPFKVITCEHNHARLREPLRRLLESKGYRRKHEDISRFDDWYVRIS